MILLKKLKNWFTNILKIIQKPEMRILPGHLSFFLVLSAIPIVTVLVYFASFLAFDIEDIMEALASFFPKDLMEILTFYLSNNNFTIGIGLTLIVAFVLASNGPHAMIVAANTLYKVEKTDYITGKLKAFIMLIFLVGTFVFTLVVLAFGNSIMNFLFEFEFFQNNEFWIMFLFFIIKWPISIFLIFLGIKLLYTMAPDKLIKSRTVNKGSLFTTVSWVITANIYSYYVSHFSRYDVIYGNLSTLVILMMVIYIFSYVFVIGMAINARTYEYEMEKSTHNNIG